jgi:hypothetical protein
MRLTKADFKQGQKVYFGSPNGEKTLGEIVKLNPTKARVKTLEERGRRTTSGEIWNVPYGLMQPADNNTKPGDIPLKPAPIKLEYSPFGGIENMLLEALTAVYSNLSPENLHCDGEASATHVRQQYAKLERYRKGIIQALGQDVTEEQAYQWDNSKRKYQKQA